MTFEACSFKECRKISCGSSRGFSELKRLSECQDRITSHLESCHLNKSGLTEAELILARADHFDLTEDQVDKMMICSTHRQNLGRFWRQPRSCQYPSHKGPRKKQCSDRDVIGLTIAKEEVQSVFKVTIRIGSRKVAHFCMKFHWFSLCSLTITNLSISITLYSCFSNMRTVQIETQGND